MALRRGPGSTRTSRLSAEDISGCGVRGPDHTACGRLTAVHVRRWVRTRQSRRGEHPREEDPREKGELMKPLPEDWDRAVAVVAHPDDLA
jgi:hypothetical protein